MTTPGWNNKDGMIGYTYSETEKTEDTEINDGYQSILRFASSLEPYTSNSFGKTKDYAHKSLSRFEKF